jgi:hypothetical protein
MNAVIASEYGDLSAGLERLSRRVSRNVGSPFASSFRAALCKAKYRFGIDGSSSPTHVFGALLNTVSADAVPEAEKWLMILIGLGLVGYQLHHKQRTLQRPFGDLVLSAEAGDPSHAPREASDAIRGNFAAPPASRNGTTGFSVPTVLDAPRAPARAVNLKLVSNRERSITIVG